MKPILKYFILPLFLFAFSFAGTAQNKTPNDSVKSKNTGDIRDLGSVAFGAGLDYGGLPGLNVAVYPIKYVALFAGGGYAFVGGGYNVGVKLRWVPENKYAPSPFVEAMYGYNAAVRFEGRDDLNKLFYGMTYGVGVDFRGHDGGLSLALLFPQRGPEVNDYLDYLKKKYNATSQFDLTPVTFSVGYRIYFH